MIRGKLTDISLEDVMALAKENGIRPAEKIVHEVASAIMDFRQIATQCGVSDNWIAAVENTLNNYLENWGLIERVQPDSNLTINGHTVSDFHIEQQFKGNYLLTATIDGKPQKYIIRKGKPEHDALTKLGLTSLTEETAKELITRFLLPA
jgi:serine/threonine-protein kinase HipA